MNIFSVPSGSCSNIADNPVHETETDKLIGSLNVVYRRRAKFMAISRLTDDFMDTSGILMVTEGELEGGMRMVNLLQAYVELGWFPDPPAKDTNVPTGDYRIRVVYDNVTVDETLDDVTVTMEGDDRPIVVNVTTIEDPSVASLYTVYPSDPLVKSTFTPPMLSEFKTAADFKTRYHQYEKQFGDRAEYSLACVLDGDCPVNFADQLTDGQF